MMRALFSRGLITSSFLIVAIAFLVFGSVIPGELVVDDRLWVVPQSTAPAGAVQVMQTMGGWVFRPLNALFLKAVLTIFGSNVSALHCVSILLHGANSILLFRLLGRLIPGLSLPLRLAATLAFVVHPAGSEAVLWISAMSELTVMAVMLATCLLYFRWREKWTAARMAVIATLFVAAYLFKETAIMLPFVLAAYELAQGRSNRRNPLMLLGAILVVPPLLLVVRYVMIGSIAGGLQLSINPMRVVELAFAHLRFIWLPAAPLFALRPPEVPLASNMAIALALGLIGIFLFAALRLKVDRGVLVLGLVWQALALWPAYAVALVGEGYFNGRQAYIATAGLSIALGVLLVKLTFRQRRFAVGLIAAAVGWMAIATMNNGMVWRSNLSVYQQAMAASPAADGPRAGVADALLERGDSKGALAMYGEAMARASSIKAKSEYLYAMASILGQAGRFAESEQLLKELVQIEPRNSFGWAGLGNVAWAGGRIDEAAEYYRRAVDFNPKNIEAVSNLASMLSASGPAYAMEAAKWRYRAQGMAMGRSPR